MLRDFANSAHILETCVCLLDSPTIESWHILSGIFDSSFLKRKFSFLVLVKTPGLRHAIKMNLKKMKNVNVDDKLHA